MPTPIHLAQLNIYNHWLFPHLEMDFRPSSGDDADPPAPTAGQWIFVEGEPELTQSLLRILAATLWPEPIPSSLLALSAERWIGNPFPKGMEVILKLHKSLATWNVQQGKSPVVAKLNVKQGEGPHVEKVCPAKHLPFFFKAAFGSHHAQKVLEIEQLDKSPLWPVASLALGWQTFDWQRWLRGWELEGEQKPESQLLVTHLKSLVGRYAGITIAAVESRRIWVEHGSKRVTADQLYPRQKQAAQWMCLLLDHMLRFGGVARPDFNQTYTGLVLIDDLVSHTPPGSVVTRIGVLQKLFPLMSFVITLRPGESRSGLPGPLFELHRVEGAGEPLVEARRIECPP